MNGTLPAARCFICCTLTHTHTHTDKCLCAVALHYCAANATTRSDISSAHSGLPSAPSTGVGECLSFRRMLLSCFFLCPSPFLLSLNSSPSSLTVSSPPALVWYNGAVCARGHSFTDWPRVCPTATRAHPNRFRTVARWTHHDSRTITVSKQSKTLEKQLHTPCLMSLCYLACRYFFFFFFGKTAIWILRKALFFDEQAKVWTNSNSSSSSSSITYSLKDKLAVSCQWVVSVRQ